MNPSSFTQKQDLEDWNKIKDWSLGPDAHAITFINAAKTAKNAFLLSLPGGFVFCGVGTATACGSPDESANGTYPRLGLPVFGCFQR